jgi:hypothetical protein
VYLWELEGAAAAGGFAGCFLIKKIVQDHKFVSKVKYLHTYIDARQIYACEAN